MSSMEHPDTEQLSAYMHDPGADDYRQLRLHLISCVDCRQQVKLLSDLNINLGEVESEQYQHAVSENGELHEVLQSQLIEEYVDGQLNSNEQLRMKKMLSRNGQAMKAAMHYASHSGHMQRELASDSGFMQSEPKYSTGYNRPAKPGILTFLRRWLEVRTPIWLTVPATAAIAGILSVVLIPQINTASSKSYLIAYQDNPVIQFKSTQNLPGIGFFSRANKITKPYGRM
ncbi:MAG: hypothetical protein KAS93_08170, partial [Gammaproteobacteria bacterium]|nr:hypothetical protein [Gammaproteobacteria bacterium]